MPLAVQTPLVPGSIPGSDVLALAREALATGFPVSALCGGQRGTSIHPEQERIDEFLADSGTLLEAAAALGAPVIVVPVFGYSNHLPPQGLDRPLGRGGHRALRDRAARAREPRRAARRRASRRAAHRYETPLRNTVAEARAFAATLDSRRAAPMAEVFHMQIEEADPIATLEREGPALGYVHLADSNRLEPGEGHTNVAAVVAALATAGNDRRLGLECRLSTPGEETLGRVAVMETSS